MNSRAGEIWHTPLGYIALFLEPSTDHEGCHNVAWLDHEIEVCIGRQAVISERFLEDSILGRARPDHTWTKIT